MIQDKIYQYFERNERLHVLFVFDSSVSKQLIDELAACDWPTGYRFMEFDGHWFSTKYAIENEWKDDKVILAFHQLSPSTRDDMEKFPLLDLLAANMEYKSETSEAFLQQHRLPMEFAPYIKRHITELSLEKYKRILGDYLTPELFTIDLANRGLISGYMGDSKLLDWNDIMIKMISIAVDDKKWTTLTNALKRDTDARNAVQSQLTRIFGCGYDEMQGTAMKQVAEVLRYNAITQLLPLAPTDNYQHFKVTNSVALEQMNKLLETALHQPKQKALQFMVALNTLSQQIKAEEILKVYGYDAQYFYIPTDMAWDIVGYILANKLTDDPTTAVEQFRTLLVKKDGDEGIEKSVSFALSLANYYSVRKSLGSFTLNSVDDYVEYYSTVFWKLDYHYRKTMEALHTLDDSNTPIMSAINAAKKTMDTDYADTVNFMNVEWIKCLSESVSTLKDTKFLKQQDFFAAERKPGVKLVVIVCDAMRYELGKELAEELVKDRRITAEVVPGLAMLPTETKYCKPALFPHDRLDIYDDGAGGLQMGVDGKILNTIQARDEYLGARIEGATCVDYAKVANGTPEYKRDNLFKRPLVYVMHNALDNEAHSNDPFIVIRTCRDTVTDIAKMVKSIHASYNVYNVIITADHGFLYNDMTFEDKDKQQITEDYVERTTRYYLTKSRDDVLNVVKFPWDQVSDMGSDLQVAVPVGANRFAVQGGGYNFSHGGASLQEMVIPVVRSNYRHDDTKAKVGITLLTKSPVIVSSRAKIQILQNEAVSANVQKRNIKVGIYYNGEPVTEIKEFVLDSPVADSAMERIVDVELILSKSAPSNIMQLNIYDADDMLNPLESVKITNKTLIEQDF